MNDLPRLRMWVLAALLGSTPVVFIPLSFYFATERTKFGVPAGGIIEWGMSGTLVLGTAGAVLGCYAIAKTMQRARWWWVWVPGGLVLGVGGWMLVLVATMLAGLARHGIM